MKTNKASWWAYYFCLTATLLFFLAPDALGQYTNAKIVYDYTSFVIPKTVRAADLNNDGNMDIISFSHFGTEPIRVSINNNQSFTTFTLPGSNKFPLYGNVVAADLDKNGYTDIIAVTNHDFGWSESDDNKVIVWYNSGNLNFSNPVVVVGNLGNTSEESELHTIDMDKDGDEDILLPGQYVNSGYQLLWLQNNGKSGKWELKLISNSQGALLSTIADLNNDNVPDIITHGGSLFDLTIYNGVNFTPVYVDINVYVGWEAGLSAADMDRDGDLDLVGGTISAGEGLFILENLGGFKFKVHVIENSHGSFESFKLDDVDQDGLPDIIADCYSRCNLTYFKNTGNFSFNRETASFSGFVINENGLALADIDNDGQKDLIAADGAKHYVWWFKNSFPQFVGIEAKFLAPTVTCLGTPVQFRDISRGKEITKWQWNFGDGHTATTQSPVHDYTNADTYTVSLTVSNNAGQKHTVTQVVKVESSQTLKNTYQFYGCVKEDIAISLAGYQDEAVYKWYYSTIGTTPAYTGKTWISKYNYAGDYTVYVEKVSPGGCAGERVPVKITISDKPQLPFIADVVSYVGPATLKIAPILNYPSDELYWYHTETDDTPFYIGDYYEKFFSKTESFYIEAVAYNSGCKSEKRTKVTVQIKQQPLRVPQFVWADALKVPKASNGAIASETDSKGNTIVWGTFSNGPIQSDTIVVEYLKNGGTGFYMFKYDATGKAISGTRILDNVFIALHQPQFLLDQDDNIIFSVSSSYQGHIILNGETIAINNNRLIIKFDPTGKVLWYKLLPPTEAVQLTETGDIYFNIRFFGQLNLEGYTFGTPGYTNNPRNVVAYYSADGKLKWAKEIAAIGSGYSSQPSVGIDNAGNIYQYSELLKPTIIGSTTIKLPQNNVLGAVLIKYSAAGEVLWYKTVTNASYFSTSYNDRIKVHKDAVYITGTVGKGTTVVSGTEIHDHSLYFAKFSLDGDLQWVKSFQANQNLIDLQHILFDSKGDAYLAGDYQNSTNLYIEGIKLTDKQNLYSEYVYRTAFAAKVKADGNLSWARSIVRAYLGGASVNKRDELLLHGNFVDSLKLDDIRIKGYDNTQILYPSVPINGIFTARLGAAFTSAFEMNGNCLGEPVTFFDISQGSDEETIIRREWDFGDGAIATEQNPMYTYRKAGKYQVKLTVFGNNGSVSSTVKEITIAERPTESNLLEFDLYTIENCTPGIVSARVRNYYTYNGINYDWYVNGKLIQTGYQSVLNHKLEAGDEVLLRSRLEIPINACQSLKMQEKKQVVTTSALSPFKPKLQKVYSGNSAYLYAPAAESYRWYFNGTLLPDVRDRVELKEFGKYTVKVTVNGCGVMSEEYYHGVTGIKDDAVAGVTVYPNPTQDDILIISENVAITYIWIYDNKGRLLKQLPLPKGTHEKKISLKDFNSGLYFIKLGVTGGKISMHKIIKL